MNYNQRVSYDKNLINVEESVKVPTRNQLERMEKSDLIELIEEIRRDNERRKSSFKIKLDQLPERVEERILDLERRNLKVIQEYEERVGVLLDEIEQIKKEKLESRNQATDQEFNKLFQLVELKNRQIDELDSKAILHKKEVENSQHFKINQVKQKVRELEYQINILNAENNQLKRKIKN